MVFDLAIIGGGINGCGIARDDAGRGASVYLCEMADLASGTSSASTKLIHGGLRYLEHYEFRLVREALREREVIWRIAPHIVWPLRFVLPHHKGLRPAWLLRLGLFFYDHLGGQARLPPTARLDLTRDPAGAPLKPGGSSVAFEYSDCWVDDARLVVLNARDAADRGAVIATRTKAVAVVRAGDVWRLTTQDLRTGQRQEIEAKTLVNAAGPWMGAVLGLVEARRKPGRVRLVQGSHIVVPRLYDHDRCYIFQNADGRIVFAIPYEDDFTLIGTTDRDYAGDPAAVAITPDEVAYLCHAAGEYFARAIEPADIVWTYAGVRPLYDDGASAAQAATRDYTLDLDAEGGAPLLSIVGGKITTYRRLALDALSKLAPYLPNRSGAEPGWTGSTALPGGDFAIDALPALGASLMARYPWLDPQLCRRLVRSYGTTSRDILGDAQGIADLGRNFGHGLFEAELRHLMTREWAETAEDVLWRRTKLGLRMCAVEVAALSDFMG